MISKLQTRILNILPELDKESYSRFRDNLTIILNDYEITEKTTELAVIDSDKTDKAIKMFFVSKKVEGCTDETIKYYEGALKRFFSIAPRNLDEITSDTVRYYLATRSIRDKLSKTSQDNELRVLRSFFKFCSVEGYIIKSPTEGIKAIKTEKRIRKPFTEKEVELLRQQAKTLRDKALIEVLYSTGARVSEIARMNISDITGDELIVMGKGEKERVVYLNTKAQLAISQYLESRKDKDEALFVSCRKPYTRLTKGAIETMLRTLGHDLNINKCHPHKFRRTTATTALNRGMSIEEVQKLLGHENIGTTTIYARSTNEKVKSDHRRYIV